MSQGMVDDPASVIEAPEIDAVFLDLDRIRFDPGAEFGIGGEFDRHEFATLTPAHFEIHDLPRVEFEWLRSAQPRPARAPRPRRVVHS